MELLYKKIIDVLEEEALCLEGFLRLLVDQQKYLVENDLENIKNCIARQQELIDRVKSLEKKRNQLVAKYSESENLKPCDITISALARRAGGEIADKLMGLQNSLMSLHQKIEKAKRKNQFLIKHSMKYINGTIRLIAERDQSNKDPVPPAGQDNLIVSKTF